MNRFIIFAAIILIMGVGCSNSGMKALHQSVDGSVPALDENHSPFPHVVASKDAYGGSGNAVLGAYEGHIELPSLEYSFTPLRRSDAIGDSFQVDLTYFFDGIPCGNCIRIGHLEINSDGNLVIRFELKHPFPAVGNRLDLSLFDVRGILVNKNPHLTTFIKILADMNSDSTPETSVAGDINFLLNADGYSTFFDIVTEDYLGLNIPGNLNPYKLFFVNPIQGNFNPLYPNGVENINQPIGHNVFAHGVDFNDDGAKQDYIVKAGPGTSIDFIFILESAYGQGATFANTVNKPNDPGSRKSPKFFVPEFNRKEAWKVETQIIENRLQPFEAASGAIIQVKACDWQAGKTPSGNYGPNGAFDDIRHKSDVESVTLDIPGMINLVQSKTLADATGNGSATSPYIWTFTVLNELESLPGDYYGMVAVRDQICSELDGTTPPFGVKEDSKPMDFREFVTYNIFTIEIPGLEGLFQADPFRKNLDLITGVTQPTSASVILDIGVVENDDERIEGVYMPDANGGITRYDPNYKDAVFHGPGLRPPNTTGTHPNPTSPMPIRRLDANNEGVTWVTYNDANETYQPNPGNEPTLPAGNIVWMFYCIIPPPTPPYDTQFPLQPFSGYPMLDIDDPSTPAINESLVEDPMAMEVFNDFGNSMGCIWETTKLVNPTTGLFDILYLVVSFSYPPLHTDPPIPNPQYNFSLSGIPATDIKGCDLSSNGYIYYGLSGPDTPAGGSLLVGFNGEDPGGSPLIGGFRVTTGKVVDVELLPYDNTMPRIINGVQQTGPIAAILTDNKTIEFIDAITGDIFQLIDGQADGSISGTPKHLDVGDRSFTVHVTHLDGTTPRVTVYILK